MKKAISILGLATLIVIMWFWLRETHEEPEDGYPTGTTEVRPPERDSRTKIVESTLDPTSEPTVISDFRGVTNKAVPALKSFLQRLGGIGISPLDPNLTTNWVVPIEASSNKYVLTCRLSIDHKWIALFNQVPETDVTKHFLGITDFWQTGDGNPYAAVSDGQTNRIATLAKENLMQRETATKLLARALNALVPQPAGEPVIFAEKYNGYELGRWRGRWWKPGADHMNQLNIGYEIAINVKGSTQAVLVLYSDAVSGKKE